VAQEAKRISQQMIPPRTTDSISDSASFIGVIASGVPFSNVHNQLPENSSISSLSQDSASDSSTFESDFENDSDNCTNLKNRLASWACDNNITHIAINGLLKILNQTVAADLPGDARTLLGTPRSLNIVSHQKGHFHYFGIASNLQKIRLEELTKHVFPILKSKADNEHKLLTMSANMDGLPIHKSNQKSLWPILGKVDQLDSPPFVIALFYGTSKPKDIDEFLAQFTDEVVALEENGITINGVKHDFRLSCVIADAPARSLVK